MYFNWSTLKWASQDILKPNPPQPLLHFLTSISIEHVCCLRCFPEITTFLIPSWHLSAQITFSNPIQNASPDYHAVFLSSIQNRWSSHAHLPAYCTSFLHHMIHSMTRRTGWGSECCCPSILERGIQIPNSLTHSPSTGVGGYSENMWLHIAFCLSCFIWTESSVILLDLFTLPRNF